MLMSWINCEYLNEQVFYDWPLHLSRHRSVAVLHKNPVDLIPPQSIKCTFPSSVSLREGKDVITHHGANPIPSLTSW